MTEQFIYNRERDMEEIQKRKVWCYYTTEHACDYDIWSKSSEDAEKIAALKFEDEHKNCKLIKVSLCKR